MSLRVAWKTSSGVADWSESLIGMLWTPRELLLPYRQMPHMVICMKTTLNIDDTVMRRLREEAARRRVTMSSLVEAGLRLVLADSVAEGGEPKPLVPLPAWNSGGHRIDVGNREELYGAMEGE